MEMKKNIKYDQDSPEKLVQTSSQPEEVMISGRRIARLGDRLIAVILDSILIGAAFAVIGMSIASRLGGVTETGFSMEGKPAIIALGLTIIFGFIYYWVLEGLLGATLGKAIIGIKVIKKDGTRCDLRSSLIRNLVRIIDIIGVYLVGFFVALFSKSRQRLGDHLANTVVVEVRTQKSLRALFTIIWVLAIGGGIWFAYTIHSKIPIPASPITAQPSQEVAPATVLSGDLKIINFRFTESKEGPIRPEAPYKPGDKVYIDYSVIGYATDHEGNAYLISTATILDPSGLPLYPPLERELHGAVPKMEKPVEVFFNYYFDLPYYAPGGKYNIHIKLHDAVENTDSESIQPFTVEAPPITPSTRLEFRDFYFSLSEDGPPVAQPVIQPGGTIYSLCKAFGIQFRDDRPDVNISIKVLGPKGEVVVENPNLLSINKPCVYRPPTFFERISAWVTLPSEAPPGRYTWKYTMTDRIANAKVDYEANFEVK